MPNKPGYFKSYYRKNANAILEDRRDRYHSDPEFRERVLEQSRKYRAKKRQEREAQPVQTPGDDDARIERDGRGRPVRLYQVGAYAKYVNRSVQAVHHWERVGAVPITPYIDERGFRFYTEPMMAVVKAEIGSRRRLFPIDPEMYYRICDRWEELGVPVDEDGGLAEALKKTGKR